MTVATATAFTIAVSSATTFFVVVSTSTATTSLTVVMATATATFTAEMSNQFLNLIFSSISVFQNLTFKIEGLASQRVIHIYFHLIVSNFQYTTVEALSFCVLQGNNGILINMFAIKFAIHMEYGTVQRCNLLLVIITISFVFRKRESELRTLFQGNHLLFKSIEGKSKSTYKMEWSVSLSFFYHFFTMITIHIEFVSEGYKLIICVIHIFIYLYYNYVSNSFFNLYAKVRII